VILQNRFSVLVEVTCFGAVAVGLRIANTVKWGSSEDGTADGWCQGSCVLTQGAFAIELVVLVVNFAVVRKMVARSPHSPFNPAVFFRPALPRGGDTPLKGSEADDGSDDDTDGKDETWVVSYVSMSCCFRDFAVRGIQCCGGGYSASNRTVYQSLAAFTLQFDSCDKLTCDQPTCDQPMRASTHTLMGWIVLS
jgi:hypothetical protein